MKRIIIYTTLIILFIFLGITGYKNQPKELPSNEIINNTYYMFNKTTGLYDSLNISSNKVTYKGSTLKINDCSTYSYTPTNSILKLDCGSAFTITASSKELLGIKIDENNYYFFKDKDSSLNKEFMETYGSNINDFSNTAFTKIQNKHIILEELNRLVTGTTTSYIYIKQENCSYKCSLVENSLIDLPNSYYINYNELNTFNYYNINDLKSDKPIILVIKNNGQTNNIYKKLILFDGFNMNNINTYLEGENNEN